MVRFELAQDVTEAKKNEKERENLILQLGEAIGEIKRLQGILPICSYCKKIRNDEGAWNQLEEYICKHSNAEFTHGICPDCFEKLKDELD
jgi:chorismate mutase